jgi:hypothetical protein
MKKRLKGLWVQCNMTEAVTSFFLLSLSSRAPANKMGDMFGLLQLRCLKVLRSEENWRRKQKFPE